MSGGVAVIDQDSIESVTDLWHCFVLYLLHVPQGSTWSQIVLDGAYIVGLEMIHMWYLEKKSLNSFTKLVELLRLSSINQK